MFNNISPSRVKQQLATSSDTTEIMTEISGDSCAHWKGSAGPLPFAALSLKLQGFTRQILEQICSMSSSTHTACVIQYLLNQDS